MNEMDFVKYRGVAQTKSGRWQVRIRNPITKNRVWLGTYSSIKEANDAYSKKKLEFESMAPSCLEDSRVKKMSDVKGKSEVYGEEKMSDVKGKSEVHVEGKVSDVKGKPVGVFRRKSGRWYAEIRNPITRVRGSVGTYETAEEAAEALRRKKEEFGLMVKEGEVQHSGTKRKTPDASDKDDNPHDVYQRKLEMWYADMRDVFAKTKSSVGENVRGGNEDLYVGVIDGYGRLIGEFSRIDDELWLCRSPDDDDGGDDDDPCRVQ